MAAVLSVCLGLCGLFGGEISVGAAEEKTFTGENAWAQEHITGIDEEGNVYEIEDTEPGEILGQNPLTLAEGGQLVNFRTKTISENTYYTDAVTGGDGYTNGQYGADAAYLGMENGKVKFMLSGVVGLADPTDVTIVNLEEAKSVSHYEVTGGRLIHRVTVNMSKTFAESYGSYLDNGDAPSYLQEGVNYYSYDGHYFYTYENFSNMLADYRAGNRDHAVNASNPYFNYFQYLPFRSKSNYSASELNSMINARLTAGSKLQDMGQYMVEDQNQFGTNALLIAGIAANESGWGTSTISQTKNNIFGIHAEDSNPEELASTFATVQDCIEEYTKNFISAQYTNPENWKYSGSFLGNKASGMNVRYASDPYWGEKAASLAWSLDRASGGKDHGYYTIGIKDLLPQGTDLNVRTEATTNSGIVYSSGSWPYQAFLIMDPQTINGFYRVQSDGALNSSRTAIAKGGSYNYANMFLYASASYIDVVVEGTAVPISYADTFAVRRGNQYFFKYSLSGGEADALIAYGRPEDEVLVGDWDGDGVDTLCVRRGNIYYFKNTINGGEADRVIAYGRPEDEVLVGDWDGDGRDTLCVRRDSMYYFKNTISGGEADRVIAYGHPEDEVLVGDWDGDGKDTLCVRRNSLYYFKNEIDGGEADRVIAYGRAGDQVLSGDWDGDEVDTLCVRRDSMYYIKNTIDGGEADRTFAYGKAEDTILVGTWLEKPASENR